VRRAGDGRLPQCLLTPDCAVPDCAVPGNTVWGVGGMTTHRRQ